RLNRAFSACLHDDLYPWGGAPGLHDIAPLTLNRYRCPCLQLILAGTTACVTTAPRTARAFAPDQEERARRLEHRCPHIAIRGRGQPDGSPRSTRFRLREYENASASATSQAPLRE